MWSDVCEASHAWVLVRNLDDSLYKFDCDTQTSEVVPWTTRGDEMQREEEEEEETRPVSRAPPASWSVAGGGRAGFERAWRERRARSWRGTRRR